MTTPSRRTVIAGGLALAFPTIIPARVLGADAPSRRINIARSASAASAVSTT